MVAVKPKTTTTTTPSTGSGSSGGSGGNPLGPSVPDQGSGTSGTAAGQLYGLSPYEENLTITVGTGQGALGALGALGQIPDNGSPIPIPTPSSGTRTITLLELEQEFWSLPVYQQQQIEQTLWAGGFYADSAGNQPSSAPDFGKPSAMQATERALANAADGAASTNQKLDDYVSQAAGSGGTSKAGSSTYVPGVTGQGPNRVYDLRNPADIKLAAQSIFQAALGRAPTDDELAKATTDLQGQDTAADTTQFNAEEKTAETAFSASQAQRDQEVAAKQAASGSGVVGPGAQSTSTSTTGGNPADVGLAGIGTGEGPVSSSATSASATTTTNGGGTAAQIAAAIKQHESGGDYKAYNAGGGAAGAYQFIQSTWSNAARAAGYGQYAGMRASQAPPAVQDAVAQTYVQNIINSNPGVDPIKAVADTWYIGHVASAREANVVPRPDAGNTITPAQYESQLAKLVGVAAPGTSGAAGGAGQSFIATAESQIGVPYSSGGETAGTGFDCSGLVQWAMKQYGIDPGRTTTAQFNNAAAQTVAGLSQAQPGDLLFFNAGAGPNGGPGHVGIYLGNGQMLDADHTGDTIGIRKNVASYGNLVGIKRYALSGGANGVIQGADQFTPGTMTTETAPTATDAYLYNQATTGANRLPFGAHTMLNGIGVINNMINAQR
jgi:cell wall-associated NlpC family hydrolase